LRHPGPRASGLPLTPLSEVPGPTPLSALGFCRPGTSDKDLALHVKADTITLHNGLL